MMDFVPLKHISIKLLRLNLTLLNFAKVTLLNLAPLKLNSNSFVAFEMQNILKP